MLRDRHPEWRAGIGKDRTFRARGYHVSTVGLNEAAVRKHIADQENGGAFWGRCSPAPGWGRNGKHATGHRGFAAARVSLPLAGAPRVLAQGKKPPATPGDYYWMILRRGN